jgi:hypothetical protein
LEFNAYGRNVAKQFNYHSGLSDEEVFELTKIGEIKDEEERKFDEEWEAWYLGVDDGVDEDEEGSEGEGKVGNEGEERKEEMGDDAEGKG